MINLEKDIDQIMNVLTKHYPRGTFTVKALLNQINREKNLRKSYENDILEQRELIIALRDKIE